MAAKQFFLPYQAATINAIAEPGATLTFYQTGTTTKLPIYTTALLDTELANPVRANAAGRFADIYLDTTQTYRLVIKNREGTAMEDIDPYIPGTISIGVTDGTDDVLATNYGAIFNNSTDDHLGVQAALTASADLAGNENLGGFYPGGPQVILPAGRTGYMGANTLTIRESMNLTGKGEGRFGPGAHGVSCLRYDAGAVGISIQATNTSGTTTVPVGTLQGSGGVTIKHIMLQGPEDGAEAATDGSTGSTLATSPNHAIDAHIPTATFGVYGRGFRAIGVKGWAGTYSAVNYGGNASMSAFYGTKMEACQIGFDFRGSDANILTFINDEAYQNYQAGFVFDTGIGPTVGIGLHTASNGMISGHLSYMCHYNGRRFAATWGKTITELTTNAPPNSATSNAYWNYIEDGAADAVVKTWNGTQQFRAGGDVLTAGPVNPNQVACFIGLYREDPGVCQFGGSTLLISSIGAKKYRIGGVHIYANNNKFICDESVDFAGNITVRGNTHIFGDNAAATVADTALYVDTTNTEAAIFGRSSGGTVIGHVAWEKNASAIYLAPAASGHIFRTGAFGAATQRAAITTSGIELPSSHALYINSQQVVGARGAAVTRISRTATSGSLPTADGSIAIANAATPTVVELLEYCTELEAKLEELTAKFRAATGHGLIA
jgi:hypothetical protein